MSHQIAIAWLKIELGADAVADAAYEWLQNHLMGPCGVYWPC